MVPGIEPAVGPGAAARASCIINPRLPGRVVLAAIALGLFGKVNSRTTGWKKKNQNKTQKQGKTGIILHGICPHHRSLADPLVQKNWKEKGLAMKV
jgi:hypothetical protein